MGEGRITQVDPRNHCEREPGASEGEEITASQRLDLGGVGGECASRPAELSETRIKTQAERRAGREPSACPTPMMFGQPERACAGSSLGGAGRRLGLSVTVA